ncbi:12536_t:CDS:1, partial [Acaulospora colombiana]
MSPAKEAASEFEKLNCVLIGADGRTQTCKVEFDGIAAGLGATDYISTLVDHGPYCGSAQPHHSRRSSTCINLDNTHSLSPSSSP